VHHKTPTTLPIPSVIMVAEKNTTTGLEVTDPTLRTDNEKSAAVYNDLSDTSSNGVGDYDDLPDPDVGKSDEERAKLVSSVSLNES
jgi:hypothetical protein